MLIQAFEAAIDNELISHNPARRAKIIRDRDGAGSKTQHQKDAFTPEEVTYIRENMNEGLLGHSIRLMLDTGLRVQELLALSPDDISEDGSSVQVTKAIKMVDGRPTLGPPKSKRSSRTIPVPLRSRSDAKYIREHGGKELIWSLPGKNPYYSVGTFRRRYYTAIGKVEGIRKLSPHCCRHTYITRLQEKSIPIELIARLAGHSDISTTDGYTHTTGKTLARCVEVLNHEENETK